MLPRLNRIQDMLGMEGVGGADADRVDIGAPEQLAVILVDNRHAVLLGERLGAIQA